MTKTLKLFAATAVMALAGEAWAASAPQNLPEFDPSSLRQIGSLPAPGMQPIPQQTQVEPLALAPGQAASLDVRVQNALIGSGQIFVSCNFDGQGERCLFDTGSYTCLVDNDAFFSRYPAQGQSCTEGAGGKKMCSDIVDAADLMIGGIDFGAQTALRRTSDQACGIGGTPNYLAGGIWHTLLGHQVSLSFGAKTLSVDAASAPGDPQPMRLVANNTFLVVPVAFGNASPASLLVDTGAGLNVLDQGFVDSNSGDFKFLADSQIQDSSCQMIPVKIYMVKSLSVAGRALTNSFAVAMDLSAIKKSLGNDLAGIIGFNSIRRYNWWVDLRGDQFAVSPVGGIFESAATIDPKQIPHVLKIRLPSLLQGKF